MGATPASLGTVPTKTEFDVAFARYAWFASRIRPVGTSQQARRIGGAHSGARVRGLMNFRTIAGSVEVLAPAKLNLFLEVKGRRPDGYHDIESLLVAVSLYDSLVFSDDPSGEISLRCDEPTLPKGGDNLVVKAAVRLKAAAGCRQGARIVLAKQVPAQAGLAGGSSDAAATLVALDRLWGLQTPPRQLHALATEIGSDVPFFLHAPAAVCRGRGEIVQSVELKETYHFVLVCPPVGMSTADVYRHVVPSDRPRSIEPVLEALAHGGSVDLGRSLFNRLQPVAQALRPELNRVTLALANLGPLLDGSLMSGSGSAYYGLCRDSTAASQVAERLEPLGLGWVRVVTCGPSEENAS
jgi:4-diphosphocytidyl-2-C-methyl-D-erythritol kinase